MKRVFFAIAIAMAFVVSAHADNNSAKFAINGTTIKKVSARASADPVLTKYEYEDSKGNKYPIYLSSNGKAFVIRTSKTGKQYKQYLDADISAKLAKEYNIPSK